MRCSCSASATSRSCTGPTKSSGGSCCPGAGNRNSGLGIGKSSYPLRSEEHTSELQSLMRISYAVFCLKKKNKTKRIHTTLHTQYTKQKVTRYTVQLHAYNCTHTIIE